MFTTQLPGSNWSCWRRGRLHLGKAWTAKPSRAGFDSSAPCSMWATPIRRGVFLVRRKWRMMRLEAWEIDKGDENLSHMIWHYCVSGSSGKGYSPNPAILSYASVFIAFASRVSYRKFKSDWGVSPRKAAAFINLFKKGHRSKDIIVFQCEI